ncbi:MAG: aminotransferase class I/II-fold pyridoxal phosphate-dependent enzyme [Pseudomonadota bacterium]
MSNNTPSTRSLVAQALHFIDEATGAVVPPIHSSTTFARDENYELRGETSYARYTSPSVEKVEEVLARLDGGVGAQAFASGLAGFAALFETVETGRHIVAPQVMYHGGQDWLRMISKKRDIGLTLFDQTEEGALEAAIRPGETSIVWIETPVNPTWDIIDIEAAASAAHKAGAILGVDATVATPVSTRPLEFGADIVFHSATKYLNGHSDVTAGALIAGEDNALWDEIKTNRKYLGSILGPFEAWLLLRGMRTLFVRFEAASRNALKIAHHFKDHARLEQVLYPGLETHIGHDIAARQMTGGFGGMMSILVTGSEAETKKVAAALKLFVPATSLGGVESLAEHRKTVEGPHSLVPDNLIRLSIGIEDADDLIADLEQALAVL